MATLKLKGRAGALIERAKAVNAKDKAVRDWSDGKVSAVARDKAVAQANDKLRGA